MSERKSASAYRTISEVAEGLGVPQHVLRFWETKFPAVKPLKRGGNRRYYRPEDIELLQVIHRLLHVDGYTIKGAQKLLKERGVRSLVEEFLGGSEAPAATSIQTSAQTAAQISAELNAEAEVEAALAEAGIPEALTVDPDVALPEAPATSQAEAEPALEPDVAAALANAALEVEAVGGSAPVALPVQEATAEPAPAPVQAVPVQDRQARRQLVLELKSIRAGLADALGGAVPVAG